MLSKNISESLTVARLSNPDKIGTGDKYRLTKQQVGIDYIINTKKAVSREMTELVHFPSARDIEFFAEGKVIVLGLRIPENSKLIDQSVEQLDLPTNCQAIGVVRGQENFRLYNEKDQLKVGDVIYLIGEMKQVKQASEIISDQELQNKRILILGSKDTGYHLIKNLETRVDHHNFKIKVVEKDHYQCDFLKRDLKHSIVLNSDFYNQEEISEAHVVISTTGYDQSNIITAALAQNKGIDTITELQDIKYEPIYNALGIDSTVNPYLTTASQIMRITREERIISMSFLKNDEAVVTELEIPENAPIVGKNIRDLDLSQNLKVGAMIKKDSSQTSIPCEDVEIQPHDRLIVFSPPNMDKEFKKYFHHLKC